MTGSIQILKKDTAVAEAELLIFIMDGSGSMGEEKTFDNRPKVQHLIDIMKQLFLRLSQSTKKPAFRVSFIYFSDEVFIEQENGKCYFSVDEASKLFKNPIEVAGGKKTAIADAILKANEILQVFNKDEGIPSQKHTTIFLLTDGQENIRPRNEVIDEAKNIMSNVLSPTLATISFGIDADEELLMQIASEPNERQIRHLDMAQVLSHLPNGKKLFIQGHADDKISEEKVEAMRSFVETLSETSQMMKKQGSNL